MLNEFKNLKELFQYFDDEAICRDYLERKRWNGNITCLYCSHTKIYKYRDFKTYRCAGCKKTFSITKGTIFEKSHIPLSIWFGAIYLYVSHKAAVSSAQIGKHFGLSQPSAWYLHHRIMQAFKIELDKKVPETGIWEVDEVYIGPLKHRLSRTRYRRVKQGTGYIHMTPILGFVKRGGDLFGEVVPTGADRHVIQPIMKKYIDPMGQLMTDGGGVYYQLDQYFLSHEIFIHKNGEYARGESHSNTIEGAFRHFKDTIRGSYKRLTRKHLQRYWDEFCFRYNNRNISDVAKFELFFKTINRPITYNELVKIKY